MNDGEVIRRWRSNQMMYLPTLHVCGNPAQNLIHETFMLHAQNKRLHECDHVHVASMLQYTVFPSLVGPGYYSFRHTGMVRLLFEGGY